MAKARKIKTGLTDEVTSTSGEDLFGIEDYISGLQQFIEVCDTPLTIAIQGDWGSGKTSIMKMVEDKLRESRDIRTVWFNTWEFSQFNMDGQLSISFLTYLLQKLQGDQKRVKEVIRSVAKTALLLGNSFANVMSGGGNFDSALNRMEDANYVETIHSLREEFQAAINYKLARGSSNGSEEARIEEKEARVVIFIDDLDRLQPKRAVELLEVLKIFLECRNCVFVLAIDYEVVQRGIQWKYNGDLDVKKARAFFDKIIQVPFKVPVSQYNIKTFIEKSMESAGIRFSTADSAVLEKLIQYSVGANPRTMKRLFNAYILLQKVYKLEESPDSLKEKLLFGCLCMQLSYEPVYAYIVSGTRSDDLDAAFFELFMSYDEQDSSVEEFDKEIRSDYGDLWAAVMETEESYGVGRDMIYLFMKFFAEILFGENDRPDENENMSALRTILDQTSTTVNREIKAGRRREYVMDEEARDYYLDGTGADGSDSVTFTNADIEYMLVGGKEQTGSATELFLQALSWMYREKREEFEAYAKKGRNASEKVRGNLAYNLFNEDASSYKLGNKEIPGTGWRVATHGSVNDLFRKLHKLCLELGISRDQIKIHMKAARINEN